jgi:hypothetical protein
VGRRSGVGEGPVSGEKRNPANRAWLARGHSRARGADRRGIGYLPGMSGGRFPVGQKDLRKAQ